MGISTQERTETETAFMTDPSWKSGGVAGFVATVVMGIAITVGDLAVMRDAIAGLYAFEGNLVAGWVAHLVHGTFFGLLFAVVLSDPGLYRVTEWAWKTVLAGVVYGLVLALAGAGVIMPIWLNAVGFAPSLPVPNVTGALVVWHLIYGLVLGATFTALDRRWAA